jgi:hypothetical protein
LRHSHISFHGGETFEPLCFTDGWNELRRQNGAAATCRQIVPSQNMKNFALTVGKRLLARAALLRQNRAALLLAAAFGVLQTPSFAIHNDFTVTTRAVGAFPETSLVTSDSSFFNNNPLGALVRWGKEHHPVSSLTYLPYLVPGRGGGGVLEIGEFHFENGSGIAESVDFNVNITFNLFDVSVDHPLGLFVGSEQESFLFQLEFDQLDDRSSVTFAKRVQTFILDGFYYEMKMSFDSAEGAFIRQGEENTLEVLDGGDGYARVTMQFTQGAAVPDGGSSFAMLGSGLACVAFLRRFRHAR